MDDLIQSLRLWTDRDGLTTPLGEAAAIEIKRLRAELAQVREILSDRENEISKLRAALEEIIDLPPTCYCRVIARRPLTEKE